MSVLAREKCMVAESKLAINFYMRKTTKEHETKNKNWNMKKPSLVCLL